MRRLDDLRFRAAPAALPLGFAAWVLGLRLHRYELTVLGLLAAGVAAYTLQDDLDPRNPLTGGRPGPT